MSEIPAEKEALYVFHDEKPMESFTAIILYVYMVYDAENPPLGIPGVEYPDDYTPTYPDEPTPALDHVELWVNTDDTQNEPQTYAFSTADDAMEYVYELSQIIWEQGDLPPFAN